jgi:hypothetical protein
MFTAINKFVSTQDDDFFSFPSEITITKSASANDANAYPYSLFEDSSKCTESDYMSYMDENQAKLIKMSGISSCLDLNSVAE